MIFSVSHSHVLSSIHGLTLLLITLVANPFEDKGQVVWTNSNFVNLDGEQKKNPPRWGEELSVFSGYI